MSELIYHILQTWFGRLGMESEEGCMGADGCIGVLFFCVVLFVSLSTRIMLPQT